MPTTESRKALTRGLIGEMGVTEAKVLVNRLKELGIDLGQNADYLISRPEVIEKIVVAHMMLGSIFTVLVELKRKTKESK